MKHDETWITSGDDAPGVSLVLRDASQCRNRLPYQDAAWMKPVEGKMAGLTALIIDFRGGLATLILRPLDIAWSVNMRQIVGSVHYLAYSFLHILTVSTTLQVFLQLADCTRN